MVRTVSVKMRPRDACEKVQALKPHLASKPPIEMKLGIQRVCVILPAEEQSEAEDLPSEVLHDDQLPVVSEQERGQQQHFDDGQDQPPQLEEGGGGPEDAAQERDEEQPETDEEFCGFDDDSALKSTRARERLQTLLNS